MPAQLCCGERAYRRMARTQPLLPCGVIAVIEGFLFILFQPFVPFLNGTQISSRTIRLIKKLKVAGNNIYKK